MYQMTIQMSWHVPHALAIYFQPYNHLKKPQTQHPTPYYPSLSPCHNTRHSRRSGCSSIRLTNPRISAATPNNGTQDPGHTSPCVSGMLAVMLDYALAVADYNQIIVSLISTYEVRLIGRKEGTTSSFLSSFDCLNTLDFPPKLDIPASDRISASSGKDVLPPAKVTGVSESGEEGRDG